MLSSLNNEDRLVGLSMLLTLGGISLGSAFEEPKFLGYTALLVITLGALRPDTWTLLFLWALVALVVAMALTVLLPRLYPCTPKLGGEQGAPEQTR